MASSSKLFQEIQSEFCTAFAQVQSLKRIINGGPTTDAKKRKQTTSTVLNPNPNYFIVDDLGYVQVYVHGAPRGVGKSSAKGGIGVWFNDEHPLNVSELLQPHTRQKLTISTCDIVACATALEVSRTMGVTKICINSDSEYVVHNVARNWQTWKESNWRNRFGGLLHDQDELKRLDEIIEKIGYSNIKWVEVDENEGNDKFTAAQTLAEKVLLKAKRSR